MKAILFLIFAFSFTACAGGTERAQSLPTPLLCKTIADLSPAYLRYDEYIAELNRRGEDCAEYLDDISTVQVR